MRLPPISRSYPVVLTKGRWSSVPSWRAHLCRRHDFRSSQTAAVSQVPQLERIIQQDNHHQRSSESIYKSIVVGKRSFSQELLLAGALELFRNPNQALSDAQLADLLLLASLRHSSLSVITAQLVLRQIPNLDPRIHARLYSPDWEAMPKLLERRGYIVGEVTHWTRILIGEDADERVRDFLSKAYHKPLFVLFYLLSSRPYFSDRESLLGLLEYCNKWYSGTQQRSAGVPDPHELGMHFALFCKLLEKLGYHAARLQPDILPAIADLAVSYISDLPLTKSRTRQSRQDKTYNMQCQVFNAALQAVSEPAVEKSYDRAICNWKAITALLSLSSGLPRPLIIERESYRAIRQILLMLPKTVPERDTASALASSWPPYRILRDGMEEKANAEDYLSRVVKAGIMMQEAGYAKQPVDDATDILGGRAPDGSPTVQTRANYPRHIHYDQAAWAALIRTTRNSQEAWAIFRNPPEADMEPNWQVYWELIVKIAAKPADLDHNNLPGDGREVSPFDDRNLTEFEKARVRPPTIRALTHEMFKMGIIIKGKKLAFLIRTAETIPHAMDYIDYSGISGGFKRDIRRCMETFTDLPPSLLSMPPLDILHACIELLCKLQPNRTQGQTKLYPKHFLRIRYAFRLAQQGWISTKSSGRAPWESILVALARPNIMLSAVKTKTNGLEVLLLATEVMERAEAHSGLSLLMFHSYARAILKAASSGLLPLRNSRRENNHESQNFLSLYSPRSTPAKALKLVSGKDCRCWKTALTPIFQKRSSNATSTPYDVMCGATSRLKSTWRVLSTTGPVAKPKVNRLVTASHINNYMRTLAFVGDYEEMALLLQWVIEEWLPAVTTTSGGLSLADTERLERAVRAFRAFAEPMLGDKVVKPMRKEMAHNRTLCWPSDEEVGDYIASDKWGDHQNLKAVIDMAKRLEEQEVSASVSSPVNELGKTEP
ncbi:prefoldin subunit [Colletotrichum kahawae]|uniref:Prefoldin subunit n=1 Tax=Colletotrichum kahawae TaxID=34407 RepID=A0AAE0D8D6_COLKA|nr:prefoldin subunit [Colletotrichum kahawae]